MIPLFKVHMNPLAKEEVAKVLDSGFIGQGEVSKEFENKLKDYFKIDYLAVTNSATSAEHLALHMLKKYGVQDGDEVLSTPLTCTASNWPTLHNNLKIKWVDIDPKNLNMDLNDLERKITPKTKVIMLVHWSGIPVNLDRVNQIVEKTYQTFGFRPFVIQDCAHAFGTLYRGKLIGSTGICTFSFQAIKHITTGDGGMLTCPGWDDFYKRAKLLRWYGIDREDTKRQDFRCEGDILEAGYKFNSNDIAAAIGLANLKDADMLVRKHKDNAAFYDKALGKHSGALTLLTRDPLDDPAFWIYSMLVEDRADFMRAMADRGVMTSQVHERNDKHTCVKEFKTFLPNLESVIGRLVHIPVHHGITEEQRSYIVSAVNKGW